MANQNDIRWRQRFDNYLNALRLLAEAVERVDSLDDLAKEGLVQRFEYTFELAWKTLKDYLNSKGVDEKFPRDVIKRAFQYGVIDNGELWLDMLEQRNRLSHTNDEANFEYSVNSIVSSYFDQLTKLRDTLIHEQVRDI